MTFPGRDAVDVDALRTDRYLESLLAAHDRRATDTPADAGLDPAVRDAATRLGRDLVRLHPSFRFEERLAARLAEVAASMRLSAAAGAEGAPPPVPAALRVEPDPLADPDPDGDVLRLPRPILIGGALTSAAISIAGAAWVAWRRSRAQSPMARAARAAHQARHAGAAQPRGLD